MLLLYPSKVSFNSYTKEDQAVVTKDKKLNNVKLSKNVYIILLEKQCKHIKSGWNETVANIIIF